MKEQSRPFKSSQKGFRFRSSAEFRSRDCASIYNSQAFIDANGTVIAKYRKAHLVSAAPIEERDCFTPGNEFSCFNFAGMRPGLSICYDLRFPEMCRTLALDHKVNVFINSSAWPSVRAEHLRLLAQARAIENQSYLFWRIESEQMTVLLSVAPRRLSTRTVRLLRLPQSIVRN